MKQSSSIEISVDALRLSGRLRTAAVPKALLFCIHGGSYTSRYFDYRSQEGQTLFSLAPPLGYSVLAIDRPGYGAARDRPLSFDEQASALRRAASQARQTYAANLPVFLVGHSIGAMLAMLMAVDGGQDFVGMDLNGAGLTNRPEFEKAQAERLANPNPARTLTKEMRVARMFGPEGTFDPKAADEDFAEAPSSQPTEQKEALRWGDRFSSVAANIRIPVSFSLGEFDSIWESGPAEMERARGLFSSAPTVEARIQRQAGHCTHLHRIARSYNLRTIAFADECCERAGQ